LTVEEVEPVELWRRGLECLPGLGFGLGFDEGTDFAIIALPANDVGNFLIGVLSEDFAAPSADGFHEGNMARRIGFPAVRLPAGMRGSNRTSTVMAGDGDPGTSGIAYPIS
jgi:hypothetical protein